MNPALRSADGPRVFVYSKRNVSVGKWNTLRVRVRGRGRGGRPGPPRRAPARRADALQPGGSPRQACGRSRRRGGIEHRGVADQRRRTTCSTPRTSPSRPTFRTSGASSTGVSAASPPSATSASTTAMRNLGTGATSSCSASTASTASTFSTTRPRTRSPRSSGARSSSWDTASMRCASRPIRWCRRKLDLYQYGRRMTDVTHQAALDVAREDGVFYIYDTIFNVPLEGPPCPPDADCRDAQAQPLLLRLSAGREPGQGVGRRPALLTLLRGDRRRRGAAGKPTEGARVRQVLPMAGRHDRDPLRSAPPPRDHRRPRRTSPSGSPRFG